MPKILHACNHEHNYETLDADKAKRLRRLLCPACFKAKSAADAAAKNAHLPRLQGTDKQRQWAETIRAKAFEDVAEFVGPRLVKCPDEATATKLIGPLLDLRRQTSAKWWIDHRETPDGKAWLTAPVSADTIRP